MHDSLCLERGNKLAYRVPLYRPHKPSLCTALDRLELNLQLHFMHVFFFKSSLGELKIKRRLSLVERLDRQSL